MKDDRLYLVHMLETARQVAAKVAGRSRADFDMDENLRLALTHLLQVIGEAARRVSEPTRIKIAELPWKQITGMRHRIVHDYMNINFAIVWQVTQEDIPVLVAKLAPVVESIIAHEQKSDGGNPS